MLFPPVFFFFVVFVVLFWWMLTYNICIIMSLIMMCVWRYSTCVKYNITTIVFKWKMRIRLVLSLSSILYNFFFNIVKKIKCNCTNMAYNVEAVNVMENVKHMLMTWHFSFVNLEIALFSIFLRELKLEARIRYNNANIMQSLSQVYEVWIVSHYKYYILDSFNLVELVIIANNIMFISNSNNFHCFDDSMFHINFGIVRVI